VTGEGDVSPFVLIEGVPFPLLPLDGGVIAGDLIVGGTDIPEAFTTVGIVSIDTPAFTDPLTVTNAFIGQSEDGVGDVTVSGQFSELRTDNLLVVGVNGQAWLNITTGAKVTSNFLAATSVEDAVVGQFEGSQGFVVMTGRGTEWEHTNIIVGDQGYGDIRLSDRAKLDTLGEAIIGNEVDITASNNALGTGYVDLTGLGTRWDVEETLTVGLEGRGELQVRNGALVRVIEDIFLAEDENTDSIDSRGIVTVSGQNSELWTLETLSVGSAGTSPALQAQGELYIRDGGRVRADGGVLVGVGDLVEISGDTLRSTLLAPTLENAGTIRGSGRLEVAAVVNQGDIRNAAGLANVRERLLVTGTVENTENIESIGGEMEFQGLVTNTGSNADIVGIDAVFRFHGGITNSGDAHVFLENTLVYVPASATFTSSGSLTMWAGESTLAGDLALQSGNSLNVVLGDEFGRIQVIGDASLAGTVDVSLSDEYLPRIGDAFEIVDAESLSGMFSGVSGGGGGPGFWQASYTSTSAILSYVADIVSTLAADFDGNGVVDGGDLAVIQMNIGKDPATKADGDANGDGRVDGADFILWQQQLGSMAAVPVSAPAAGAVPEPAGLAMALVAFAALVRRRR
jgi:T5SS/PEP-CTERM-associated repeat protein